MRRAVLLAVMLGLPAVATGTVVEDPATRATSPGGPPKRLDLGPYGRPVGTRPTQALLEGQTPRFESRVDVHGHVPPDLNQTMAVWWRHFAFQSSIYGRGYNIQTPVHPGSINLIPLFEWLAKKAKKD